jgi:Tol biopolymer transport system component
LGLFSKLLWGGAPRAKIVASYDIPKKFKINPLIGVRISPDGSKVGYVLRLDEPSSKTSALVVNGEMISPGPDEVDDCHVETGPDFSYDGNRVACGLRADGGYRLMLVRIDNPATPEINLRQVPGTVAGCQFIHGSDKVIYRVITHDRKRGQKFLLMCDGERISPDFEWVSLPFIDEDGKKLVYAAQLNERCYFIVNDKHIPLEIYRAGTPVFSPDNGKLVFCAKKSEKHSCLVSYDLTENKMSTISDFYSDVSSPAFNCDGTKVVYTADHRFVMIYDFHSHRTERIPGDMFSQEAPVFSPDGKTVAYKAKVRLAAGDGVEVFHVFVNDKKVTPFYAGMDLAAEHFSETGEVCYAAYEVISKRIIIAKAG